jgi:hypothetical protein
MTKTIPVYIGASNIGTFFNADGIIQCNNVDEAIIRINSLTPDYYYAHMSAINDNYERSLAYVNFNEILTRKILTLLF